MVVSKSDGKAWTKCVAKHSEYLAITGQWQNLASTTENSSRNGDALNRLEMLSSLVESHAHGNLTDKTSQPPTSAAVLENLPTTDDPIMCYQGCTESGATVNSVEFDPFRDLDNAFGDFSDLSIPATFFDPHFEDI